MSSTGELRELRRRLRLVNQAIASLERIDRHDNDVAANTSQGGLQWFIGVESRGKKAKQGPPHGACKVLHFPVRRTVPDREGEISDAVTVALPGASH